MQIITSVNNEKIKNAIKLKQKKYRDEQNLILIEGYKIFLEALKTGQQIEEIFCIKEIFDENNLNKFENITSFISENVSEKLSFNQTSQNFFAVIKKPIKKFFDGSFLILDRVQDPQNLGAIIRTSVACDIKNIYLLESVDEFNDKVIRASMGNVFKVCCKHISVENLSEICKNKEIFCADMNGENLFSLIQKPKNFGLILGNEGQGVSDDVKFFATKTLSIPMKNDVESLNVAVSSAIIIYNLIN